MPAFVAGRFGGEHVCSLYCYPSFWLHNIIVHVVTGHLFMGVCYTSCTLTNNH